MQKLPECDRCQFNARSQFLVCAIHPQGVAKTSCLDYRRDPTAPEDWAPESFSFYGGELIPHHPSHLTESDRTMLLDRHPLFTGRCPQCDHPFTETPAVHWDCPRCQWKDDSGAAGAFAQKPTVSLEDHIS